MRYLCLLLFFSISNICFPQVVIIDSLRQLSLELSGIERAKVLNKLSEAVVYTDPSEALKVGQEAFDLAEDLKNDAEKYEALRNIGYANGYTGNFHESIKNMEEGLVYYRSVKDSVNIAKALSDIGYLNIALSDISTGIEYYEEALDLYKKSIVEVAGK
jgi:tetratricopeptide (TPR) repeat protein